MKEIRINTRLLVGGLLAATGAAVAVQWPEIQRYLKVRAM
jgi:hypothetical protein